MHVTIDAGVQIAVVSTTGNRMASSGKNNISPQTDNVTSIER